jgi:hypothetical protein
MTPEEKLKQFADRINLLPPDVAYLLGLMGEAVAGERDRVKALVVGQPYYPDTDVGMRQQWVKDEILRKIDAEGEPG